MLGFTHIPPSLQQTSQSQHWCYNQCTNKNRFQSKLGDVSQPSDIFDEVPLESLDQDDDDDPCNIMKYLQAQGVADPQRYQNTDSKLVFLISDGTGTTVKSFIQKSLAQFGTSSERQGSDDEGLQEHNVQTRMFNYVRGEEPIAAIVKKAEERKAMVAFTMADPLLREKTLRMCDLSQVPALDLLGPTLDAMSSFLNKAPIGVPQYKPSRQTALSNSYYRRIEAMEFTLKADDGQSPWLLPKADIILLGVSRTGKTPLSVVTSQTMGLKVANIPLVLECPPPKELLSEELDPNRIFCLTIAPSELKRIRTTRLERRKVKSMEEKYSLTEGETKSNYADRNYLLKDLKNARDLTEKYGWTQIDVTGRAVEETASYIGELMNERFGDYSC